MQDQKTKAVFTDSDKGCWIDGAYGEDHAKNKMASMLEDIQAAIASEVFDVGVYSLLKEYNEERMPSGSIALDQWITDATDDLQRHTADGLVWIWDAGDLILTSQEEIDCNHP